MSDLVWAGIGQGKVLVTPMHMAMITSSIANGGAMVKPTLVQQITKSTGVIVQGAHSPTYRQVISEDTARIISDYMYRAVQSGTAKRAAIAGYEVCGKTGSGKGVFTKTEMTGTIFSNPTDEIYVIDRAGEYTAIAERYGGSTYHFGVGTGTHLNPFDTVSVEHMTRNEQIAFKVDAMLAQAGASAAEAGSNFSEVDQSLVQRCTELAFQKAAERGDNLPPTLQDFYDAANEQPEEQAQVIALRYERFVKGSMNFFNHQSNVDFNTRIVDFNLKDLPDSMLVFALINVCEAVRNRMYFNAKRNVRTWLYVEEMQSMFAYPTVLNYFSRFSNEGRKFGLLLTGISQNATAMLANEAARNIVLNADFLMLLKQSPLDRMKWAELLNLSEQEEECIDESAEPGDGLLIAGNARVPIRGKFPSGNVLYDLFSTNPNETKKTGLGDKKDAKPVI